MDADEARELQGVRDQERLDRNGKKKHLNLEEFKRQQQAAAAGGSTNALQEQLLRDNMLVPAAPAAVVVRSDAITIQDNNNNKSNKSTNLNNNNNVAAGVGSNLNSGAEAAKVRRESRPQFVEHDDAKAASKKQPFPSANDYSSKKDPHALQSALDML